MERYTLIAVVIIIFWIIGFAVYLVSSNRQREIEGEITQIDELLGESGPGDEA